MLSQKQLTVPTCQSHRNTQIFNCGSTATSRLKNQFKYDINDYLPSDHEVILNPNLTLNFNYKNSHFLSFGKKLQSQNINSFESRFCKDQQSCQGEMQNYQKERYYELSQLIKKKQGEIQQIKLQNSTKQKNFQEQISKFSKQIQQLTQKSKKLSDQNNNYAQKIKVLQDDINKLITQKKQITQQLNHSKKQMSLKTKNIRIFCQKYQITYEPKLKQTYTIQVQTQKDLLKPLIIQQQNPISSFVPFPSTQLQPQQQPHSHSNRKISCSSKPQFYQLYQQQQQKQNQFDLNNQYTSRSQMLNGGSSGLKPKKPSFMDNNSNNLPQFYDRNKQNDKKRINQRIDGIIGSGLHIDKDKDKSKQKLKIKNQQIQIYPIDQSNIEAIVQGILSIK